MESNTPFDAIAVGYDQSFTETSTGRCQREKVYACLGEIKAKSGKVLEINCGTGEDAVWWAHSGWQVVATDISGAMTEVCRLKVEKYGLQGRVEVLQSDALDITTALRQAGIPDGFDVVFSNFGGVNCIAPERLPRLAEQLQSLLKPGGKIVLVVMGRFCWWETLYFMAKGNFKAAFRRFSSKPSLARLDENTTVNTWYYSPGQIKHHFPDFKTELLIPVGFWAPPSYLDPLMIRFPGLMKMLKRLERRTKGSWAAYGADHYLMVLSII